MAMQPGPIADALKALHQAIIDTDSHEGRVRLVNAQVNEWRQAGQALAREQRNVLRAAVKAGMPWADIAKIMHVSRQRVQQITGIQTRGRKSS